MNQNQPQLFFLDLINDRGMMKSAYQNSLHECPAIIETRNKEAQENAQNTPLGDSKATIV